MLLLASRPGSQEPAQGMAERLVVSEDEELPTLQLEAEMADSSKQFPVKRHCSEPQRVTASWRRRRAGPMMAVGSIVHGANCEVSLRVLELGGCSQSIDLPGP